MLSKLGYNQKYFIQLTLLDVADMDVPGHFWKQKF